MPEPTSFKTFLKAIAIGVGIVFVLAYVGFQARYLIIGPQILLNDAPSQRQNERQIFLTGTAYNISHLWLNDRPIFTDAQGNFKEALVLENGYTVATLRAKDRYGRETRVAQSFVYSPASIVR